MNKIYNLIFIIASILATLNTKVYAQSESQKFPEKKICVLGGACGTIKLYKRYDGPYQQTENIPKTYIGPTISIYYCKTKNAYYMFQTGLEYSYAKYFVLFINDGFGRHSTTYINTEIIANTFTIPAYFNLLLLKQKTYLGIGPNFDVIYSIANSKGTNGLVNESFFVNPVNIGVCAKLGYKYSLGKENFVMEARIKSGILNLLPRYSGVLYNEYISILAGYMF